ncbi:hypothetical protein Q7P37_010458 [Cladosporium fusiforme]
MPSFLANDGVKLHYETHGEEARAPLILLHGFTGSGKVFQRNVDALAQHYHVLVPDLRGHGASEKPRTGYHVARLAVDLKNFIDHLGLSERDHGAERKVAAIGASLGAAILWFGTSDLDDSDGKYLQFHRSYAELFTPRIFSHLIFVDQAPLQNYLSDWGPEFGNRGMNSPAALANLQSTLAQDAETAHRGTIASCLGYRSHPRPGDPTAGSQIWQDDEAFFLAEALKGNGWWYGKLMADHTANDWRSSIAHSFGPGGACVLVVASERSGCFPAAGPLKVVELVNGVGGEGRAKGVVVEWGGHWCYWEKPALFNALVLEFLMDRAD